MECQTVPVRLVIIGGVAGGATAAARARRLSEDAEIVLVERGAEVSFANCGLPYHVGGEIADRRRLLVQTRTGLMERFRLDIRIRTEALAIVPAARCVRLRDLASGREYEEPYDALLLSPGAAPVRPPLPGIEHPRILTLRNLSDMDRIKEIVDAGAARAVVVGGGFIGLEMAENLRRRGTAVTLVELLPQVLPPLDPEMATPVHEELARNGVQVLLGDAVAGFADDGGRVRATLRSGATLAADLVVLAVGVRPDTGLAQSAGLRLTSRGAILVDDHMRTSNPHIYAVGDAVEVGDPVLGDRVFVPLAGPANRQARIAVDNIFGRSARFRGTQGTSIVRVFGVVAAATGASEKRLKATGRPYRRVYIVPNQHAAYFPGAQPMILKLLFAPDDGRVLGAQIVGGEGVDKRIDVLALAIQTGLTVADLAEAELAYAPQFGSAKDPVNMAGFVAANVLSGDDEVIYAEELDEARRDQYTIVDVREPGEHAAAHIPGAHLIPLGELRDRWDEIPRDKPIVVHCAAGQRAYYACRFLRQRGVPCRNLSGGLRVYRCVFPRGVEPAAGAVSAPATGRCG